MSALPSSATARVPDVPPPPSQQFLHFLESIFAVVILSNQAPRGSLWTALSTLPTGLRAGVTLTHNMA